MLKSSLLEILRTFTKQELIKFVDFVMSPYFNKKENVTKLFLEIKKYAPDFKNENLEKETIWEKIFPGKKYNYGIMKNLIFDLSKLCESILSEEVYKKNELRRDQDFISSIAGRSVNNLLMSKFDSAERVFRKDSERFRYSFISEYFEQLRDHYEIKSDFLQSNMLYKKKDELIKLPEYLIFGFIIKCFSVFHKIILSNLDFNTPVKNNIAYLFLKEMDENSVLENLLNYTKEHSEKNYPVLKCYYSMYKALSMNDSIECFHQFKNDLSKYAGIFSEDEKRDLYNCLLTSLGNRKFTTDNFQEEYFSIIEIGFKNKVILNRDGTISPDNFISIVNVTCSNNKIEFAENFISDFNVKLPEEYRESLFNYSMAQLNFSKGNFEKSLEYIIKFQTRDIMCKFFIKNLQLSIYYELNDRVSFDYSIDSFRHFIKKIELSNESRVIVYTKYIDYVSRLFKLREKENLYLLSKLKKEITDTKATNKIWLLKKIEELENKR